MLPDIPRLFVNPFRVTRGGALIDVVFDGFLDQAHRPPSGRYYRSPQYVPTGPRLSPHKMASAATIARIDVGAPEAAPELVILIGGSTTDSGLNCRWPNLARKVEEPRSKENRHAV